MKVRTMTVFEKCALQCVFKNKQTLVLRATRSLEIYIYIFLLSDQCNSVWLLFHGFEAIPLLSSYQGTDGDNTQIKEDGEKLQNVSECERDHLWDVEKCDCFQFMYSENREKQPGKDRYHKGQYWHDPSIPYGLTRD